MTISSLITQSASKRTPAKYYIGLMSGTSADGIDLALVDFSGTNARPRLVAKYYQSYSSVLAQKITQLYQPENNEIDRAFHLDIELAKLFSKAINALLIQENLNTEDIIAIGNHGQTIRHRPKDQFPFTLQIGCCQTLATLTGIRVVGQFRRKDMALGGQGAPLVPIFHQQLFSQAEQATFVVNIGGIANISYLPEQGKSTPVLGFDTGPGNALLDDWFVKHHANSDDKFDKNGAWANKGKINQALLLQLMSDDYIQATTPKSTGREYFHLTWLEHQLGVFTKNTKIELNAEDVQATLVAFTAQSICDAIKKLSVQGYVYLCGGGVHNPVLIKELRCLLNATTENFIIDTVESINIDSDLLEAMAFAWLAYAFDHKLPSNLPAVTGASRSCTLGCDFFP